MCVCSMKCLSPPLLANEIETNINDPIFSSIVLR